MSGSTDDRPQYRQMLRDAKDKLFDILLADDLSRLTRDEEELIRTRKRLVFWGVRLVGVTDGIDTAQKGYKMLATVKGMINEQYREDLADKTKRGMAGRALKGFHVGGRIYGYRLEVLLDEKREHQIGTKLVIDPDQAKWVQFVYQKYVDGWSPWKIVDELNQLKVPPPGLAYRRKTPRKPGWSAAALHGDLHRGTGMLNNKIYTGLRCWNRSKREVDPDTKTESHRWRPESEWVKTYHQELRIISDQLWNAAQARRQAVSKKMTAFRATQQGARSTGRHPKFATPKADQRARMTSGLNGR